MKILVLGGTHFIGRHTVESLLAAGHSVTILNRGNAKDELPSEVERLRGDRDQGRAGIRALEGRSWDACVDLSGYTAIQVRASAELLRGSVGRYVYVSSASAYIDAGPELRPVREDCPLLEPIDENVTEIDGETYGRLKVTCENIIQGIYADRATILRPQVVAGPFDTSGRYTYWVDRAARGGEMLAPGDGTDHIQVIDVRDVARFIVTALEKNLSGAFNLAGPRMTWAEFMKVLGANTLTWVPAEILESANLAFNELPLYRPEHGSRAGLMDMDTGRARAAGLVLTAPEVTARDTRAWSVQQNLEPALTAAREAELIARARSNR